MSDLGFWNLATAHPERTALVTPEGTRIKAGDLLARSNQLVHGLRRLGLAQGDVVATLLPNGAPMIELYLAATQAGLYLVPINHHLAAPEIAYILARLGGQGLRRRRPLRRHRTHRRRRGRPTRIRLLRGRHHRRLPALCGADRRHADQRRPPTAPPAR